MDTARKEAENINVHTSRNSKPSLEVRSNLRFSTCTTVDCAEYKKLEREKVYNRFLTTLPRTGSLHGKTLLVRAGSCSQAPGRSATVNLCKTCSAFFALLGRFVQPSGVIV